jgi:hypothetical protein
VGNKMASSKFGDRPGRNSSSPDWERALCGTIRVHG